MRDKQLVVLEKFLNSQENVKLLFLLFVVGILVLGSIPPSAGMEMRVFCMIRVMVHSRFPGLWLGTASAHSKLWAKRVLLNRERRGNTLQSK